MVWSHQYNQEPGRASLNYISLGLGFVIGLQISGPLIDKVSTSIENNFELHILTTCRHTVTFSKSTITLVVLNFVCR